jgi:hypothetical protein
MPFTDIFSLILSCVVFPSLRFLSPRNIVPRVSTSFENAQILLECAEATNIPSVNVYRTNLALYASLYPLAASKPTQPSLHFQFLQMRTESHRSPGFFWQLYLLFVCGLSWRLYLKSQVDAIKERIEVGVINILYNHSHMMPCQLAVDELQLSLSATTTAFPVPAAGTHMT